MPHGFFDTVRHLRKGLALDELDAQLAELVREVRATGKGGELVLKLKFRPPKKAGGTMYVSIEDTIRASIPDADRGDTVLFPLADGSLVAQNPDQLDLTLRPVPDGVDPQTGEVLTRSAK